MLGAGDLDVVWRLPRMFGDGDIDLDLCWLLTCLLWPGDLDLGRCWSCTIATVCCGKSPPLLVAPAKYLDSTNNGALPDALEPKELLLFFFFLASILRA